MTGPCTQHDVGIKATWLGLKTQVKYFTQVKHFQALLLLTPQWQRKPDFFSLFLRVATTNKTGQKRELTREKLDVDGVKCH